MNVKIDKFQGERPSVGISDSVQTLLIIGIIVKPVRRRFNRPVSRDDRSFATLREANAETSTGIAQTRFEVQI